MGRRVVLDLETTGLLDQTTIDYTKFPYRLKPSFKIHYAVARDLKTDDVFVFDESNMQDLLPFLQDVEEVIGHNIIDFDLRVLQLYLGLDWKIEYDGSQDWIGGRKCRISDTQVISKTLHPDREGGHSLDSWGKRTGNHKTDYKAAFCEWKRESNPDYVYVDGDEWKEANPVMLEYCIQDTSTTKSTYYALLKEAEGWDWKECIRLEKVTQYIVSISRHYGFKFDTRLAETCLEELTAEMERIQREVEPLLPPKKMGVTDLKKFIPPEKQTRNGGKDLSSYMQKFIFKHGGRVSEDMKTVELYGVTYPIPMPSVPVVTTAPMTLADQGDLKEYLVSQGWVPSNWTEKDLTIDDTKRKVSKEKYLKRVENYVKETLGSPYEKYRCAHLGCSPAELEKKLLKHRFNKPLKVITTPSYTINADKDLCPNLEKLGETAGYVQDVVKWLVYRHRRNSIRSTSDGGYLAHVREDGRIPTPADTCGAGTHRFQHKLVANIPRTSSIYGEKMRSLFGSDRMQLGYDFSGLEARIEAHYTRRYPGGEQYIVDLLAEKPNDVHQRTADKLGLERPEAKTARYSLGYGAQPARLARTHGWSLARAEKVFKEFWDLAMPLKMFKERLTAYWKKQGGSAWVVGLGGDKLYSRSEHSLVNLIFQNAGVTCAKRANMIHYQKLEERGLLFNPFKDSSRKGKAIMMIMYHDEAQWDVCPSLVQERVFSSKEKAEEFRARETKPVTSPHEENGKWVVRYSIVGDLAHQSVKESAKFYGLRVELDSEYEIGKTWASCH